MATIRTTAVVRTRKDRDWGMSPELVRATTVTIARQELRKAQAEGVFPSNEREYVTVVDGRSGQHGRERKVRAGGKITYLRWATETDWVPAAIELIRLIMARVPVGSKRGDERASWRRRHYSESFAMLRNNAMVVGPGPGFRMRAIKYIRSFAQTADAGDVFSVTNIQPYARRIEEGAPGHTPWSSQAPGGVLKWAYRRARSRKNTKRLFLDYEMRPLPGGISDTERSQQGANATYADRRRRRGAWVYSGKILQKHRVYPVLSFGPPYQGAGSATNRPKTQWTHRPSFSQEAGPRAITRGRLPRSAALRGGTRVDIRVR